MVSDGDQAVLFLYSCPRNTVIQQQGFAHGSSSRWSRDFGTEEDGNSPRPGGHGMGREGTVFSCIRTMRERHRKFFSSSLKATGQDRKVWEKWRDKNYRLALSSQKGSRKSFLLCTFLTRAVLRGTACTPPPEINRLRIQDRVLMLGHLLI